MVLGRKRGWGWREEERGGREKGGKERGKKCRSKKGGEGRKRFKCECCEIGKFLFSVPAVDFGFELLPHIISLVFMGFFLPTLILNAEPFRNQAFRAWRPNNVRTFSEYR